MSGTKAFLNSGQKPVLLVLFESETIRLATKFLNKRFSMIKQALADDNKYLDRSIYEDALFTKNNAGVTCDTELSVYLKLLDNMMSELDCYQESLCNCWFLTLT